MPDCISFLYCEKLRAYFCQRFSNKFIVFDMIYRKKIYRVLSSLENNFERVFWNILFSSIKSANNSTFKITAIEYMNSSKYLLRKYIVNGDLSCIVFTRAYLLTRLKTSCVNKQSQRVTKLPASMASIIVSFTHI